MPSGLEWIPEQGIDRALFTSYAISLTFFETVILRKLRQAGCGDIWIVVDRDGYEKSLMERRSSRVGQEYRLIPAAMPNGILHAKCTYLQRSEFDRLLIGSGNLTFGGYGRNLEVLEIFDAPSAGNIFDQFADFLDSLNGSTRFECGDRGWINSFAQRSRIQARVGTAASDAALVHTNDDSLADQLAAAVDRKGRKITVLSPFHDTDGRAVRRLAEITGSSQVSVAITTGSGEPSTFPFARAADWDINLDAVKPKVEGKARPLHAKWFEIELADHVLTLTGSANATTKAISTTDNVEVGVLRSSREGFCSWEKTGIPRKFQTTEPSEEGSRPSHVIHATLLADGQIRGLVLGSDVPGSWIARISLPDGHELAAEVEVRPQGEFDVRIAGIERFLFSSSLQIELIQGERRARGWVHYDELLRMPRLRGLGVSALLRLMTREETDDDVVALLDYLSSSAHKHVGIFGARVPQGQGEARGRRIDPEDVHIPVKMLEPKASVEGEDATRRGEGDEIDALGRFFARLRRVLLRPDGSTSPERGADDSLTDADEGAEPEERVREQRIERAVEGFDRRMRELLNDARDSRVTAALFVMWLEVQENMLVIRMNRPDEAVRFGHVWLARASEACTAFSDIGPLEEHIVSVASLLGAAAAPERRLDVRRALHERLEAFYGGDVPQERALACIEVGSQVAFVRQLVGDNQDLASELIELLRVETVRLELTAVLRRAGHPDVRLLEAPLFSSPEGRAFLAALASATWERRVREVRVGKSVCAHCNIVLTAVSAQSLRSRRFTRCSSCGKFTVRTAP